MLFVNIKVLGFPKVINFSCQHQKYVLFPVLKPLNGLSLIAACISKYDAE